MTVSIFPRGTTFTRCAVALALAEGDMLQAAEIAESRYRDTPEAARILRAAVAAGGTAGDLAALASYQTSAAEFVELTRAASIVGRISGFRRIPFRTRVPQQTTATAVGWAGEGLPKRMTSMDVGSVVAPSTKVAGIAAITEELLRFSSPSAEALIRADLVAAIANFVDAQFVDDGVAPVADTSPGSILFGAPSFAPAGSDAAGVVADVGQLFDAVYQGSDPVAPFLICGTRNAYRLAAMRGSGGAPAFPDMQVRGGSICGIPVIASASVPDTSSGSILALVEASRVLLADDGQVTLDASRHATLQFDSAPSAGEQTGVNLWQSGLVALRAERVIHWQRSDEAACAYIAGFDL